MSVVVLFTRHNLTEQQQEQIESPVDLDCSDLASTNINSSRNAHDIVVEIIRRIQATKKINYPETDRQVYIYGVIPVPIRAELCNYHADPETMSAICIETREAFNVQRSVEGQKPTFEHKGWLHTGTYWLPF